MAVTPKYAPVWAGIKKGLEKIRKWYKSTDDSDMYFISLGLRSAPLFYLSLLTLSSALHPGIKLEYCKTNWDEDYYQNGYEALMAAVCPLSCVIINTC